MNTTVQSTRRRDTLRAYDGLRRLLLQQQIPPGTRLKEVEWSTRLKTSRPSVREAFAMLAHEEMLARGERGGFFVAKYTEDDLYKILQARIVLETGALQLLAHMEPDPQLLDRMAEYCETMEYLLDNEVLLGYGEMDRKFHATLVELAGNEWLVRMYRRTPSSHFAFPEADSAAIREMGLAAIRDHREIHRGICDRRIGSAVATLQKHLTVDPALHYKF
jgi:DNA-binding GntR family transcriptional regulator